MASSAATVADCVVAEGRFTFKILPERLDFPATERLLLGRWRETKCFERSVELAKGRKPFSFYDGPPFATGLPHYGHILAGTIKDVVCRYAHQTGHYVERRFGWDCHGLPIEFEIDKELGIRTRQEVINLGIAEYNAHCKAIVLRYAKEWESIVERTGRWVDFKNGYRTMDRDFMESVWWTFKQLFDKQRVFRAFKVMPFSTACGTPLSNFEANQNYKEVSDPSVVVAFDCLEESEYGKFSFVAWTTTPWTLPSNLALCVHPDSCYVRINVKKMQRIFVMAESRMEWVCKQMKVDPEKEVEVLEKMSGITLKGLQYKPVYDCWSYEGSPFVDKAWRVCVDTFVTDDSGTGIVHCAPAFGEDDYRVCVEQGIVEVGGALPCPIDDNGIFTYEVPLVTGLPFKEADKIIKSDLKDRGVLLASSDCIHTYPFCWRSDTPLIYKAVPSWFVKVEDMRQQLQAANLQSKWVPLAVQEKRFHNWLAEAKDWCVSRNRFWGTPVPLWTSEDGTQIVCIGSVAELEGYAGHPLPDIHRHCIDHITIPDPRGSSYPPLKRVEEVFDCWFESGSMPYAQQHYPFENKDRRSLAELLLRILLSTVRQKGSLWQRFGLVIFKAFILVGLVLAADGRKMSKRLQNYPPPLQIIETIGADALRLYLLNSPVVRGETLRFKEEGVREVVRDVLLPWFHATRFLTQETVRYESRGQRFLPATEEQQRNRTNVMDKWILSEAQHMVQFVRQELEAYRLYTIVPRLISFLEQLTNWYLRLNRDRMRGAMGDKEALEALQTLYSVLLTTVIYMAPLTPFLSEYLYDALRPALSKGHPLLQDSVHFVLLPEPLLELRDMSVETRVQRMQSVITIGRTLRERQRVPLKRPVLSVRCLHGDEAYLEDLRAMESYIKDELNACDLELSRDCSEVKLSLALNFKVLGPRIGRGMQELQKKVQALSQEQLQSFVTCGQLSVDGITLEQDDATIRRTFTGKSNPNIAVDGNRSVVVLMDFSEDATLQRKAVAREVANRVQKMRKQLQLHQHDDVLMFASSTDASLSEILTKEREYINNCLRRHLLGEEQLEAMQLEKKLQFMHEEDIVIGDAPLRLSFARYEPL